jgi:hypothetical protein
MRVLSGWGRQGGARRSRCVPLALRSRSHQPRLGGGNDARAHPSAAHSHSESLGAPPPHPPPPRVSEFCPPPLPPTNLSTYHQPVLLHLTVLLLPPLSARSTFVTAASRADGGEGGGGVPCGGLSPHTLACPLPCGGCGATAAEPPGAGAGARGRGWGRSGGPRGAWRLKIVVGRMLCRVQGHSPAPASPSPILRSLQPTGCCCCC